MGKASRRKQGRILAPARPAERHSIAASTLTLPTKFLQNYGPGFLLAPGPLFVAQWWFPASVAQMRAAAGHKLPPPKRGAVLLDTGADKTCISLKAAQDLGLKPTRMQPGFGAGGQHVNPVFLAAFELHITDDKTGLATAIGWEQEVAAIPNMDAHTRVHYGTEDLELVGLLGRDFLRYCRFVYDGPNGTIEFEVDLAAVKIHPSR